MRKAVPVLLALLIIPVAYFLASSMGGDIGGTDEIPAVPDVVLKLDKTSYAPDETMVLTVVNNADSEATTGYEFQLYRLENGNWKEVNLDMAFIEIAIIIEPGKSWEQIIDLSKLNIDPGHYKIVKSIFVGNVTVKPETEFDIKR
ncbi:immunoglobulin-like domain-containing protein [Thermococcus piezophilus]|uniref:Bacterial Ig-like domain-containing protein n=1 Tax=Thermococcus piezophilus TaxID=1712654 RepID=A0A172WJ70_9EURY|nr:immunoglobulin-like domain-containing protein [Thermococcus piezophilus]ANF23501.1 hypothetical protein A7C91_10285 [Thermococcus piezophilus]